MSSQRSFRFCSWLRSLRIPSLVTQSIRAQQFIRWGCVLGLLPCVLWACGGTIPPPALPTQTGEAASPLGPSYVLIPVPGEDDSLLGRILLAPPEPGRSLDEVSRPNPCLDKLAAAKSSKLQNEYLDAQDVSMGGAAKATLAGFGFSGQVSRATHFVYRLKTERKVSRVDTSEYEACCKEKGCGYGYISALVDGSGEYAAAREINGSGKVDFALASAEGSLSLSALSRRKVRGFLAVVITVTDSKSTVTLGPLGAIQAAGISEATLPESIKEIYDKEKIFIVSGTGPLNYQLKDARGALTENDFVRRFRDVTGSRELDPQEQRRNSTALWGGGALVTAGVAAVVGGGILLSSGSSDTDDGGKKAAGAALTGVGIGGPMITGVVIWGVTKYDGSPEDHNIPERQARLLVDRYNRALLRKTLRQLEDGRKQSRDNLPTYSPSQAMGPPQPLVRTVVSPALGGGVLVLQGSF